MKPLLCGFLVASLLVVLVGCEQNNLVNETATDKYDETTAHKERVAAWCKESLFKGNSEEEIYSALKARTMHYIAVAFLEMFPESDHSNEVAEIVKQFSVQDFSETRLISYEDLETNFGFNGKTHIYPWDNSYIEIPTGRNLMILGSRSPADAVPAGRKGDLLDVVVHPNQSKYPNQKMLILNINEYAHLIPFVQQENEIFLITIIPSRKATKEYL